MGCLTTYFSTQCSHVKQSTTTCCSRIHDISWFLAYLLSDCYVLLMRIYINIFYKSYQSLWYVYLIRGRLLEELPGQPGMNRIVLPLIYNFNSESIRERLDMRVPKIVEAYQGRFVPLCVYYSYLGMAGCEGPNALSALV